LVTADLAMDTTSILIESVGYWFMTVLDMDTTSILIESVGYWFLSHATN